MADVQILAAHSASAPEWYEVPNSQEIMPKAVSAIFDGTGASGPFVALCEIVSDAGIVVAQSPSATIAAGGSAEVSWFPGAEVEEEAGVSPGVIVEELMYDTRTSGITSSTVLTSGVTYTVTVQGTYSLWNSALEDGTPEANAMFPTSGSRASTEVGLDPDVKFAAHLQPGSYPQHTLEFQIDTGSGYSHVEPVGGPYSIPQPNHLYTYQLTGAGSTVSFRVFDSPQADNYGFLQIQIRSTSGTSGGGGGGSLVPPANGAPDGDVLTLNGGFAAWEPNTASGTISDITSTGATITVTSPTGPTTNLDLPTTGVSAGSYGDSSHVGTFTVDAEGRLTAAASTSITGGGAVAGADGWVTDTNSYTFATANSFTVGASDLTAVYSAGTRIKLTQTTTKYFVVTSSSFGGGTTTVNITAGTDYALVNAAITNPFYSYVMNPQGFPGWFNYTTNATGFSSKTSDAGRFRVAGNECTAILQVTGTSNASTFTADLPVAPKYAHGYTVLVANSGGTAGGRVTLTSGATSGAAVFGINFNAAGGFTTSGTKGTSGAAGATNMPLVYEI